MSHLSAKLSQSIHVRCSFLKYIFCPPGSQWVFCPDVISFTDSSFFRALWKVLKMLFVWNLRQRRKIISLHSDVVLHAIFRVEKICATTEYVQKVVTM
jgi:hypothetical protein